jgi:hypothetical protein
MDAAGIDTAVLSLTVPGQRDLPASRRSGVDSHFVSWLSSS